MDSPKPAARTSPPSATSRTSPMIWALLLLLVAMAGYVGFQKWSQHGTSASPALSPQASPAGGADSTGQSAPAPAQQPARHGGQIMVG